MEDRNSEDATESELEIQQGRPEEVEVESMKRSFMGRLIGNVRRKLRRALKKDDPNIYPFY